MFEVPSGVRSATVATTSESVLGSRRAETATRTKAQRATMAELDRTTGVDGTKAGLTGTGTATPWIESRLSPAGEGGGTAEGDSPGESERQVKAPTARTEATSTEARGSPAMPTIR
jgi:hypothetical protein